MNSLRRFAFSVVDVVKNVVVLSILDDLLSKVDSHRRNEVRAECLVDVLTTDVTAKGTAERF